MSLSISCPSCEKTLRVPESLLGQAVKCPSCAHNFTAPESLEEPAPRRVVAEPIEEYEEEPRPSKRRPRDDDHDDYDDEPRPRRRRNEKPGKVQAIGIMVLIGGIFALITGITGLGFGVASCIGLLWPGIYYAVTLGIMALIRGINLLGDQAYKQQPPSGIAVMMIINIINCDVINLALGIVTLVFLNDDEVKDYFR
jgi:predicted Zn finger-like uncharacterized protein